MANIRDIKYGSIVVNEFDYGSLPVNEINYADKTVFLNDDTPPVPGEYGTITLKTLGDDDPMNEGFLQVDVTSGTYPNSYDPLLVLFEEDTTFYIRMSDMWGNGIFGLDSNISSLSDKKYTFPLYRGDLYLIQTDTGGINTIKACLVPKNNDIKEYLDSTPDTIDWALKLGVVPVAKFYGGPIIGNALTIKDSYVLETDDLVYIDNQTHDTVPNNTIWEGYASYGLSASGIVRSKGYFTFEQPVYYGTGTRPHPKVTRRDGSVVEGTAPSYISSSNRYTYSYQNGGWLHALKEPELKKNTRRYTPDIAISKFTIKNSNYYLDTSATIEEIKQLTGTFSKDDGGLYVTGDTRKYFVKNDAAFPTPEYVDPEDTSYNQEIEINYSFTLQPGSYGISEGGLDTRYLRYFRLWSGTFTDIEHAYSYYDPITGSYIEMSDVCTPYNDNDQLWADTEYTLQGTYHKKTDKGYTVPLDDSGGHSESLRCLDNGGSNIYWANEGPVECMIEYIMADGVCMTCFFVPYDPSREDTDKTATNGEVQRIFSGKVLTIWPKKVIKHVDIS